MVKFLVPLTFLFILFSCNSSKNIAFKQTDFQINFGNSGGVTNQKIEYVINNDGNIFKIEEDTIIFYRKISRKHLNEFKDLFKECDFENIKLNSPGNMTYFLKIITPDYVNKVTWSDTNTNQTVDRIYIKLMGTLKK